MLIFSHALQLKASLRNLTMFVSLKLSNKNNASFSKKIPTMVDKLFFV